MAVVSAALDLNGAYLPVAPYQEIDLQLVAVRFWIPPRVEEQAPSGSDKALSHSVLGNHSAVEIHIAGKYRLVQFAIGRVFFQSRSRL